MRDSYITGDHKTQLISDGLHGVVVLFVVVCTTVLAILGSTLPQDVIGTVYGGAIGYAAGRAGNIASRRTISDELGGRGLPVEVTNGDPPRSRK
jgi:hypothetical protein